eukprot:1151196-Pelagomonas_calceolata.AAC.3
MVNIHCLGTPCHQSKQIQGRSYASVIACASQLAIKPACLHNGMRCTRSLFVQLERLRFADDGMLTIKSACLHNGMRCTRSLFVQLEHLRFANDGMLTIKSACLHDGMRCTRSLFVQLEHLRFADLPPLKLNGTEH